MKPVGVALQDLTPVPADAADMSLGNRHSRKSFQLIYLVESGHRFTLQIFHSSTKEIIIILDK